jgi:hypothetical protein
MGRMNGHEGSANSGFYRDVSRREMKRAGCFDRKGPLACGVEPWWHGISRPTINIPDRQRILVGPGPRVGSRFFEDDPFISNQLFIGKKACFVVQVVVLSHIKPEIMMGLFHLETTFNSLENGEDAQGTAGIVRAIIAVYGRCGVQSVIDDGDAYEFISEIHGDFSGFRPTMNQPGHVSSGIDGGCAQASFHPVSVEESQSLFVHIGRAFLNSQIEILFPGAFLRSAGLE